MLTIKEALITSVSKNTFREIVIRLKISPDEYTPELEAQLYDLREKSESIVLAIQPSGWTPPPDSKADKLSKLHRLMLRKEEMEDGYSVLIALEDMYKRYQVSSRKELTDKQIDDEIVSLM